MSRSITADNRSRVVDHLHTTLGVDPGLALRLLAEAKADNGYSLNHLAGHITSYPDAWTRQQRTAAPAVIRLSALLHDAGFTSVVIPRCIVCGAVRQRLEPQPSGLFCPTCVRAATVAACSRCGNNRPIYVKADGVCRTCWREDPVNHKPCRQCGRVKLPAQHGVDGTTLCAACYRPPSSECVHCGKVGRAKKRDEDGPVCASCYRYPKRACGRCGNVRRVNRRDRDAGIDLCATCVNAEADQPCAVCTRTRPIAARWPRGGVCHYCYEWIRMHPDTCSGCGNTAVLIGFGQDRTPVCGPCGTSVGDFTCHQCGQVGEIYARHRCTRCVLHNKLITVFAGPDGTIPAQLNPLIDSLLAVDRHYPMLHWLNYTDGATLLSQLAQAGEPITHQALDGFPQTRAAHHLRDVLTNAGVLQVRDDEYLARVERLIGNLTAKLPPAQAHIIRQYAQWFLIRRARRRAQRKPVTIGSQSRLRGQIRAAIQLLQWLDHHELTLASLSQPDLERWAEHKPTKRTAIENFIGWTTTHSLSAGLTLPRSRRPDPSQLLDTEELLQQLNLCLDHTQAPVDVRVAGAFVLLFGIPLTSTMCLTSDDLAREGSQTFLLVGRHRLLLPPRLAALVGELEQRDPVRQSTLTRTATTRRWLFPSTKATRPTTPAWMGNRLRQHGITVFRGRNAARMALAARIPAAILASQTGIHIGTAITWSKLTARDWLEFVAIRH